MTDDCQLTQEPGDAGLYLRPDELPLLQHQAGLQLREALGRPVDQALDPQEGLRFERQILQPAPHVQHTGVRQLQAGQVPGVNCQEQEERDMILPGVKMVHSLPQNISVIIVVF